ncbi:MAG: hypothetical protein E7069_08630 [Bacteroidales bacterium]|nr:hypothetical protein [Bacteroidales bacterium]
MKLKILFYSAFAVMLSISGCKEEPSQIPTVPTTFSLEDGAVVYGTKVELNASGSSTEDQNVGVSYVYYIGKSIDDLAETSPKVELEYYTQYFWCAQAKTEAGAGERSQIRTFYCVPQLTIETDNGEDIWAAILRFKNINKDRIVGGKVTAESDLYQYEIDIAAHQDSCCLEYKKTDAGNNAYKQWWDDSKGIYYEPIIYEFKVELELKVGDNVCKTYNKSAAKECILNKKECVRDHEFNVYRVVTIGNRQWLADDLRATSFVYKNQIIELDQLSVNSYDNVYNKYKEVTLEESNSVGIVYMVNTRSTTYEYYDDKEGKYKSGITVDTIFQGLVPKGYHISTNDDWVDLEKYYGLEDNNSVFYPYDTEWLFYEANYEKERLSYGDRFQGVEVELRRHLSSMYDWKYYNNEESAVSVPYPFNAKPFVGNGRGCIYYVAPEESFLPYEYKVRIITTMSKGLLVALLNSEFYDIENYVSLRCVKD